MKHPSCILHCILFGWPWIGHVQQTAQICQQLCVKPPVPPMYSTWPLAEQPRCSRPWKPPGAIYQRKVLYTRGLQPQYLQSSVAPQYVSARRQPTLATMSRACTTVAVAWFTPAVTSAIRQKTQQDVHHPLCADTAMTTDHAITLASCGSTADTATPTAIAKNIVNWKAALPAYC